MSAGTTVHLFYGGELNRHRATGEPVQAFCGYVLRKGAGRSEAEKAKDPRCAACEVEMLERSLVEADRNNYSTTYGRYT